MIIQLSPRPDHQHVIRLASHNIGGGRSLEKWTLEARNEFSTKFQENDIIALQEIKSWENVKQTHSMLGHEFASIPRNTSGQLCFFYRKSLWCQSDPVFDDGPYREAVRHLYTGDSELHIVKLLSQECGVPPLYVVNSHWPKNSGVETRVHLSAWLAYLLENPPPACTAPIPAAASLVVMGDFNLSTNQGTMELHATFRAQFYCFSQQDVRTTPHKGKSHAIDLILWRKSPPFAPVTAQCTDSGVDEPQQFPHNHYTVWVKMERWFCKEWTSRILKSTKPPQLELWSPNMFRVCLDVSVCGTVTVQLFPLP